MVPMFDILEAPALPVYHISPNKRAGCGDRKWTLSFVWFQWNLRCGHLHTLKYVLKIRFRSNNKFLKYGQSKPKVGGTFIQAGAFIQQNTVLGLKNCELSLTSSVTHRWYWNIIPSDVRSVPDCELVNLSSVHRVTQRLWIIVKFEFFMLCPLLLWYWLHILEDDYCPPLPI